MSYSKGQLCQVKLGFKTCETSENQCIPNDNKRKRGNIATLSINPPVLNFNLDSYHAIQRMEPVKNCELLVVASTDLEMVQILYHGILRVC